jgi:hypothetical protein
VFVLSVAFGALDRFTDDGTVEKGDVIGAAVFYWLLASVGTLLLVSLRRGRWKEVTLLVVSVAFGLGVAEAGLRIVLGDWALRPFQGIPSRSLHHLYAANARMFWGQVDGKPLYVDTNEDGLRSRYSRREFRRFRTRVVMMGDSFPFGFLVRQDAAFPTVVEASLRQSGHADLAVLNAGVISYSPALEELLYDQVITHYQPTAVMLFLDASDIGDDIQYREQMRTGDDGRIYFEGDVVDPGYYGALHMLAYPAVRRYAAYPFQRWMTPPRNRYYDFRLPIGGTVETNRFFIYRHPLEQTEKYFEATLGAVSRIAARVKASGARFVLVILPRFQHWNPAESPKNWEAVNYAREEPYQYEYFRFFDQARARVDYEIVDLLPEFRRTKEFPLVFEHDPHWTERGHGFVADVVSRHIRENGLAD